MNASRINQVYEIQKVRVWKRYQPSKRIGLFKEPYKVGNNILGSKAIFINWGETK